MYQVGLHQASGRHVYTVLSVCHYLTIAGALQIEGLALNLKP